MLALKLSHLLMLSMLLTYILLKIGVNINDLLSFSNPDTGEQALEICGHAGFAQMQLNVSGN